MELMRVGVTGTQRTITDAQRAALDSALRTIFIDGAWLHHGDCIGADAAAAALALNLGFLIAAHPPTNPVKRAYALSRVTHEPLPYLDRNQAIVDSVDLLIAVPSTFSEVVRSGTWATVRRARKRGLPIHIIAPDGTVTAEPGRS